MENMIHKREKWPDKARVRPFLCTLAASLLVAGGCFNPKVKSGGFACNGPGDGQCPAGYFCVGGLCLDSPNGVAPGVGGVGGNQDLSQSTTQDLSMVTVDMAMSQSIDMTQTGNIIDMAQPVQDMALSTGNGCAHSYCMTGAALHSSCDPCVTAICNHYKNCCNSSWIQYCVDDVKTYCGASAQCP
jgi:hypothetical protein